MLSLAVSGAFVVARPDLTRGAAFLFSDEAVNLFVAGALQDGQRLYTDVAYPYGPLPLQLYRFVCLLAGNTPLVYLWTLATLAAISAALMARGVGRQLGAVQRIAILLWMIPAVPMPGATLGGYTSSIYMPVERILLLAAVLMWRPPSQHTLSARIALGVVLGICQGVRFGSGIVMLVAMLVADLLAARATNAGEAPVRRALRGFAWILAGFAAAEIAWVIRAFATLPVDYALEFLWPVQMWETHRVAVGVPRWPTWSGWKMAATQYLLPVMLAGLGLLAARRWMKGADRAEPQRALEPGVLLLIFYALGAMAFFRHEHHFRQFVWMLIPGAAGGLVLLDSRARLAVVLVSTLALWPAVSALTHRRAPDRTWLTTPKGFRLLVEPDTARRVEFLEQARSRGAVLFVPNGTGWLYAYGVPHVSRHAWFYSRAVVRPFEEPEFAQEVARASRAIVCDSDERRLPLPDAAVAVLEGQFVEAARERGCRILAQGR